MNIDLEEIWKCSSSFSLPSIYLNSSSIVHPYVRNFSFCVVAPTPLLLRWFSLYIWRFWGLEPKRNFDINIKIQYTCWQSEVKESEVAQSCPTLCDPMDCSLSGSSVHGIFQARVLEWIAISFSRGSFRPRNRTRVSRIAGRRFTVWATREGDSALSEHTHIDYLWEEEKKTNTREWRQTIDKQGDCYQSICVCNQCSIREELRFRNMGSLPGQMKIGLKTGSL